jgi:hypothetical protein
VLGRTTEKTLNGKEPMNRNKRLLVAVDDSKTSMPAVNKNVLEKEYHGK